MDRHKGPLRTSGSNGKGEGGAPAGFLDSALEIGWLLTAVLAPLWINLWSSQPFDPAKAALVRSLIWLLAGIWLGRRLLSRKRPLDALRRQPLFWPVAALAAVLVAATLLAPDPRLSLFGSFTRGQGLLTLLSYLLLFLVVGTQLRTIEEAQRLTTAIVLTAVPLIALGAAQAAGRDPLGLTTDAGSPVYATLGRPNFLGAYVAMLLPPTLALLWCALSRRRAALAALIAALLVGEGALVALSATRAPLLAAGAGLAAFAFFGLWPTWSRRQRLLAAAVAFLAALAGVSRLLYVVRQATAGSVAARRAIWSAVWELIGRRPLFGYGPDSLELLFPGVYPPELVYYQGRELFVDRAHNLFLDWTVAAGLVGVTALALLLGASFAMGLRRLARVHLAPAAARPLLAASLAAVAANLAGNLVSFDVTATAVTGWLLMALAASPALAAGDAQPLPAGERASGARPASWTRAAAAGLLVVALFVVIVQINGRLLLAGVDHRQATLHGAAGDWQAAVASARRAVDRWPAEPEHHRLLGRAYLGLALASGHADSRTLAQAEASLLTARDLRPQDVVAWTALGRFYHQVGVSLDPGALALAHEAFRQAVTLAPHDARLHVAWAEVYLAENVPEPAAQRLRRAINLDATDGLAYRLLGDVALAEGDAAAALESYRQAARWSPESALAHLGLARTYWALGRRVAALAALNRAVALEGGHPAVRWAQEQMAP